MIGNIPGMEVHWGLVVGIVACIVSWVLIEKTRWGFAARIAGGNVRAAQIQGLPVGRLIVGFTALAGAFAGLAGMIEVAAVQGSANASTRRRLRLYRHPRRLPGAAQPAGDHPGRLSSRRHRCGRRPASSGAWTCRTPPCWCCRASCSSSILFSDTFYGRIRLLNPDLWKSERALMEATADRIVGRAAGHPRRRHPRLDARSSSSRSARRSPSVPAASISASKARSSSAR